MESRIIQPEIPQYETPFDGLLGAEKNPIDIKAEELLQRYGNGLYALFAENELDFLALIKHINTGKIKDSEIQPALEKLFTDGVKAKFVNLNRFQKEVLARVLQIILTSHEPSAIKELLAKIIQARLLCMKLDIEVPEPNESFVEKPPAFAKIIGPIATAARIISEKIGALISGANGNGNFTDTDTPTQQVIMEEKAA